MECGEGGGDEELRAVKVRVRVGMEVLKMVMESGEW